MTHILKNTLFLLITAFFLLSCGVPKTLRTPESSESAIIGVSIRTITLLLKHRQDVVYFVKLDEKDDSILVSRVIPSNYQRGNYAYLINAQPGRYAVVGSSFVQSEQAYSSFYDAETIKKTIVDVAPKSVAYIGTFEIDNQMKHLYQNIERNGDTAQLHYYNLMKNFMYGSFYCGSLRHADQSPSVEKKFLIMSRNYFKDTGWTDIIDARIKSLESK